ncbi:MAG: hypothetical protein O3A29_19585 [Planctomycetota bacterium]|nr:hypothetical protein [Planctomycetota bacterium]
MDGSALLAQFEPKPTGKVVEYQRQLFQARISPCGKYLIASGYDATVQRWDISGDEIKPLIPLTGHNAWVQCLAYIPQTERIITADSWGQLAVWSYVDESPTPIWKNDAAHDGWIRAVAASPDGKIIATGGNDFTVRLWSAEDGSLIKELPHPDKVFSLAFHPAGTSLASGDLKGIIRDWDIAAGSVKREFDAKVLYQFDRIQDCGGVRHIAFDAAGKQFVCTGQKTPGGGFSTGFPCALLYDWETGQLIQEMQVGANDDGFAYDALIHPTGFVMATTCAFPGKGFVWLWKPGEDKPFYQSNSIPNGRSISLHPDGRRLALLVSVAPNANGRQLVDGVYQGGSSKIHILEYAPVEASVPANS